MRAIPWSEGTKQVSLVKFIGFICILSSPLWVYGLFFPFAASFGPENRPLTTLPVLVLVIAFQLVLTHRVNAGDRFMAGVMLVGFLLKLAAVSAFLFMVSRVYEGADMFSYFSSGSRIVDKFSLTGDWTFLHPFWSSNFIIMLTSWLVFVFGPSLQAIMIIFAAVSFWGQYLFFRAFCIAFPTGRRRTAALLMFFLPSIVFWPAAIGKDAVIFFSIGACCYGFAKVAQRNSPAAFVTVLVSLVGVMLVRPHVAGMVAISLFCAYVLSRNQHGLLGMAGRCLGIPLLLIASVYFVTQARAFMDMRDIGQTRGVLTRVAENNQIGGSAFGGSLTYRIAAAPFLLFRPFLWEVRSPQAAIAWIEGLGLMIFVWRRRELVWRSFRSCRENAFVLFLWVYILEFSLVFAGAMSNFGLLARQRLMLIPLALMTVLSQQLPSVRRLTTRR